MALYRGASSPCQLLPFAAAGGFARDLAGGLWPYGRPEPSPLEEAEASEAHRRVATVLASLPLVYREALLLVSVEGLRHAEAAEICGVTPEAMRQRLSRARALFARGLAGGDVTGLTSLKERTT